MGKYLTIALSVLIAITFFAASDGVFQQADVEIQEWEVGRERETLM